MAHNAKGGRGDGVCWRGVWVWACRVGDAKQPLQLAGIGEPRQDDENREEREGKRRLGQGDHIGRPDLQDDKQPAWRRE